MAAIAAPPRALSKQLASSAPVAGIWQKARFLECWVPKIGVDGNECIRVYTMFAWLFTRYLENVIV